jgi:hypothetical protein
MKKRIVDEDKDSTDTPWGIRASLSLEEPCAPPTPAVHLKYERHKRRWSYTHRCWSIDLTQVRSNLPFNRDDDDDTFEVEVELTDQGMLLERTADHLVDWGWKIANELCELMVAETDAQNL